jgi:hypothetical protein
MQPIYVEVGDEITTVIERLKASPAQEVALVVPKGAVILQSIVNLKLIRKAANDTKKELTLITTDKIGRNLAAQVGIANLANLDQVESEDTTSRPNLEDEAEVIGGVRVHRYYDKEEAKEVVSPVTPEVEPIIVPVEEPKPEPVEDTSPIVVREIAEASSTPAVVEVIRPRKKAAAADITPSKKARTPMDPRRKRRIAVFATYLLVLLLLAATGVSAVYLPSTKVTITVPGEAWTQDYPTTATTDTALDATHLTTTQLLSTEISDTQSFAATGTQNIGDKASGTATLSYNYSSTAQVVPAGTRILANGVYFDTQNAITVPGATLVNGGDIIAGKNTVAVVAETEGTEGNLTNTAGTITTPPNIIAQITSTTGGTTKEVKVVSQSDIANAKTALIKKLEDAAGAQLDSQSADKDYLTDTSTDNFSLSDFHYSVDPGTQADTAQVSGKGTLKRLVVDKAQLESSVRQLANASIKSDQTLDISTITTSNLKLNTSTNTATLTATVTGETVRTVPTSVIQDQLTGKTLSQGTDLIKALVSNAQVSVEQKPSWWPLKRFPLLSTYLHITVSHE